MSVDFRWDEKVRFSRIWMYIILDVLLIPVMTGVESVPRAGNNVVATTIGDTVMVRCTQCVSSTCVVFSFHSTGRPVVAQSHATDTSETSMLRRVARG